VDSLGRTPSDELDSRDSVVDRMVDSVVWRETGTEMFKLSNLDKKAE
jgi:hypothetical protein